MKNSNQISTKFSNLLLVLFFIVALALRWLYLPQKAISFAYDQARDAYTVEEMLSGHLKVLGPPVSGVPGLFHGVLYYYVIAPAYYFGHGDPVIVAYFLSFVSSLGVFAVYYLTRLLTKNKTPALLAALIFAFSFEANQYANLMTNASMGVWFVPIFYLGLYLWITRNSRFAPTITGLGLGFAIQSEVALTYHFVPLIIWLLIFRNKITRRNLIIFAVSFLLAVSTMLIAEVRFHFTSLTAISYLLSGKDGIVSAKELSDCFVTVLNQSGKTFAYTIFPINIVMGGLLGFFYSWLFAKTRLPLE